MQMPTEESIILDVMSMESGIPVEKLLTTSRDTCGSINDPTDRGGVTSIWGWTEKTLRACGCHTPASELTFKEAYELYAKHFYVKSGASEILKVHPFLAKAVLNFGVHAGYQQAAKKVQELLNFHNNNQSLWKDIAVDGSIGKNTVDILCTYLQKRSGDGDDILFTDYLISVGAFYQQIVRMNPTQEKYMMGWSRRIHLQLRDYFRYNKG